MTKAKRAWSITFAIIETMDERNIGLVAAGAGFFVMLAIFPALAALIAILGIVAEWGLSVNPQIISYLLADAREFLPADAFEILDGQVDALLTAETETLGWATVISTGLSLFWARQGVASLVRGLNAVYRERHRGTIRRQVNVIVLTGSLVMLGIVALLAIVSVPVLLAFVPLGRFAQTGLIAGQWVVVLAVLILGFGMLYRYGPNRSNARPKWISPGAILAVLLWGAASYAFSLYLANFGRYNEVYGSLGAVVALLMWLYLSAYIALLGAALNAELELRTRRDTTTGPPEPMGERGAYVADNYIPPEPEPESS
ncbi:MAG: YihY/virulence factor BrkB family protein [Hasllibacter sp.]